MSRLFYENFKGSLTILVVFEAFFFSLAHVFVHYHPNLQKIKFNFIQSVVMWACCFQAPVAVSSRSVVVKQNHTLNGDRKAKTGPRPRQVLGDLSSDPSRSGLGPQDQVTILKH